MHVCGHAFLQEKEEQAMDKMVTMLPQLGPAVKALALRETAFSVEDAVRMLEVFQSQNHERLHAIHQVGEGGEMQDECWRTTSNWGRYFGG